MDPISGFSYEARQRKIGGPRAKAEDYFLPSKELDLQEDSDTQRLYEYSERNSTNEPATVEDESDKASTVNDLEEETENEELLRLIPREFHSYMDVFRQSESEGLLPPHRT